jgi:hypothetical protein
VRGCADSCVIWRGTAILAVSPHGLEARATEFRTVPEVIPSLTLRVGIDLHPRWWVSCGAKAANLRGRDKSGKPAAFD